jgi:hypothetical protein
VARVNIFNTRPPRSILGLPKIQERNVREMAKATVTAVLTRTIAAVGMVGALTFCVAEPASGILVVANTGVGQPVSTDGNGWG